MNFTIVDYFGYNLSSHERFKLIKESGFNGISGLLWQNDFDSDYQLFPKYANDNDLFIETMHAPYSEANDIWVNNESGCSYKDKIIGLVGVCSLYKIPTLVLHPEHKNGTRYSKLPENFNIGLDRIKQIVEEAERLNINIAIENMCHLEYLDVIFSNIQSKKLGFCFDSGHWNIFMQHTDLLTLYGDKLMALHLHDNDGIEDWHALPLSGNINWNNIATKLKSINYNGAISLEVGNKNFEKIKEASEFLQIALENIRKIFVA